MIPCPHCGAGNSDKRATCCECGKPLGEGAVSSPNGTNVAGRLLEIPPGGAIPTRPVAAARRPRPSPPPELTPTKQAALAGCMFYGSRGQVRRAAIFFRELSELLASGMGVLQALSHLESKVGLASRAVIRDLQQQAKNGRPLSEAMARHPRVFLSYQIGLLQAGELAGSVPQVLARIASHLEADYRLRLEVAQQTFIFKIFHIPGILVMLPVLFILLRDFTQMPGMQQAVQMVIEQYGYYFLRVTVPVAALLVLAGVGWPYLFGLAPVQRIYELITRPLPVLGKLQRLATLSRFVGMLATLWGGGLPPSQALEAAAVAGGSRRLAEQVLRVAPELQAGSSLTGVLERIRVLDRELISHLRVGEVSGNLPEALERIAARYQQEYESYCKVLPKMAYASAAVLLLPIFYGLIYVFFVKGYYHYAWELPLEDVERAFGGNP